MTLSTDVIMPALEMAQETGKLIRWLKHEGQTVVKGEAIMEIETDKVTVEIEASASGTLAGFTAQAGDTIPVGQTIALILARGESLPDKGAQAARVQASPVARKIAKEHDVDLSLLKPDGKRIGKSDVLAYLQQESAPAVRLQAASPKARRLAAERDIDLVAMHGSGPNGAVLTADVLAAAPTVSATATRLESAPVGTLWRVMAERVSNSWTSVPHFYLTREVMASGLIEMRQRIAPAIEKRGGIKPTYTDLLVKMVASVLRDHPRLNASWADGTIRLNAEYNIGVAIAVEEGLIVPVIHKADGLSIGEIAAKRRTLVEAAHAGKLRPAEVAAGSFTISNLGMYNVDAFSAIINSPQAAILAVGRIADRVVALDGEAVVRPTMILTLGCDHRVVDGARAAEFLDNLSNLIEEPWGLLA